MARRFGGVMGPMVTPFKADESLDLEGYAFNVRAHIAAGLDGVLVAGSTGEAALLMDDERRILIEAARKIVPEDRILLAGTGAESTRHCIARCRDAASSGADAVMRFASARPGGGARIDGVLSLGCNISIETCFVTSMLARMSSRHPERLLADLRSVGESATELDTWLTIHTYLVAMLRKFRAAVDPLRSLAREVVRPFEAGGESPFTQWYRDASTNIPVVRCLFEDSERHRTFVSSLVLHPDSHRLGDRYREDSILIEPDTGHFELEKPDVVSKHLEAMLAALEVPAATAT